MFSCLSALPHVFIHDNIIVIPALPQRYHDAKSVDFVRKEAECCFHDCNLPTMTLTLPDGDGNGNGDGTTRAFFCEWHSRHPGQNPPSPSEEEGESIEKEEKVDDKSSSGIRVGDAQNISTPVAGAAVSAIQEHREEKEDKKDKEEDKEEEKITCAADLLIVLGTSLAVAPVAGLVDEVHWLCPRLLINREVVHLHGEPKPEWPPQFGPDNGFRFDAEDNYRDVACVQDCDEGTRQLAVLLGWEKELDALVAAGDEN